MIQWLRYNLFMVWVWVGHNAFGWHYIDIYSPDSKNDPDADVVGITFSSSAEYINKVQNVEGGE